MKIRESFKSGFGSILHNKLRSFLTMLGIIIGVTSVILLTSIGDGIKNQVASQIESMGANLLYVMPGKVNLRGAKQTESKLGIQSQSFGEVKSTLTYSDVLTLKDKTDISAVTGIYNGVDRLDDLNLNGL